MKVFQLNNVNFQPSFSAKFSPETLQKISKNIEKSPEGNQRLNKLLTELKDIGSKDTVIEFGEMAQKFEEKFNPGSAYTDYLDVWINTYKVVLPMKISNPKLPGAVVEHEDSFSNVSNFVQGGHSSGIADYPDCNFFDFAQSIISKGKKIIEEKEIQLFKNFIKPGENGLLSETFVEQMPIIKDAFRNTEQIQKMAEYVRNEDKVFLKNSAENIRKSTETLNQQKSKFKDLETQITDETSDIMLERDNILRTFA